MDDPKALVVISKRHAAIWPVLLIGCGAPTDAPQVRLQLQLAPDATVERIEHVTVVSGTDRYSWPHLDRGKPESLRLDPGSDGDPALFLSFRSAGDRQYWHGPSFAAGSGYSIRITIHAPQRIDERHCRHPCRLD